MKERLMSVYRFLVSALVALALVALIGCKSSQPQQQSAVTTPASNPSDYSARLNSPNVSEYEKEQIRKQQAKMSGGSMAADPSTFGRPAPGGAGQ
jgi:hypothetical protein